MKAKEIAKYLDYVQDDIDLRVISTEEYKSLLAIAVAYSRICAVVKDDHMKDVIATFKRTTLLLPPEHCLKDI